MVAADAASDAVERAKRLPEMGVGLHLVVVCGRPILPPDEIPDLVDKNGAFETDLVRAGFRFFFLPKVRRQLRREIRAQFQAFAASGLPLDHVNAHNHMHLHPTILSLLMSIGREYGARAVRVPSEPLRLPGMGAVTLKERIVHAFLSLWLALMRFRLQRSGLRINDRVYGIRFSGAMIKERLLDILDALPNGVSEIFSHPARGTWDGVEAAAAEYRFEDEYQALIDQSVGAAVDLSGAKPVKFQDL